MRFVKNTNEAIDFLKSEIEQLEKKADEFMPEIKKLFTLNRTKIGGIVVANAFKRKDGWGNYQQCSSLEEIDAKLTEYRRLLDSDLADLLAVHEENKPLIENNKAVREKVGLLMKSIGIPDKYSHSYYKSSRSSKKTTETKRAGYLEDLDRTCFITDGYDTAVRTVKERFDVLARQAEAEKVNICKDIQEKAAVEKEKQKVKDLAWLQVKYNLPPDSDFSEIQDVILSMSKYLRLACAMEQTRNDWNDGFYLVENALTGFKVVSDTDKAIEAEIMEILQGDEDDGRIFRDCNYNYSVLYSMVEDAQLVDDLSRVNTYLEEY